MSALSSCTHLWVCPFAHPSPKCPELPTADPRVRQNRLACRADALSREGPSLQSQACGYRSVGWCAGEKPPEFCTTPRAEAGPLVLPSAAFLSIPPALSLSVLEPRCAQEASGQPTFPRSPCLPMLSHALPGPGGRDEGTAAGCFAVVSRSVALMLTAFVPVCTQMLPRAEA